MGWMLRLRSTRATEDRRILKTEDRGRKTEECVIACSKEFCLFQVIRNTFSNIYKGF